MCLQDATCAFCGRTGFVRTQPDPRHFWDLILVEALASAPFDVAKSRPNVVDVDAFLFFCFEDKGEKRSSLNL